MQQMSPTDSITRPGMTAVRLISNAQITDSANLEQTRSSLFEEAEKIGRES